MNWKFWQKKRDPVEVCMTKAVTNLGASEQDVAATLLAKQVKGRRGIVNACPIANYLTDECDLDFVSVGHAVARGVRVNLDTTFPEFGREVIVPLPNHVQNFIRHFDRQQYPELDLEAVK